jgi:putative transposase
LIGWLGIALSKFNRWSQRLGTCNQHNAIIPRDFWLEEWEKIAIVAFRDLYPLEGYRRLAFMMIDADVVAVSPSSVYRVLKAAGKLAPRWGNPSKKGSGFEQPLRPHEHWHIDVTYINICGTFFFLCCCEWSRSLMLSGPRSAMGDVSSRGRAREVPVASSLCLSRRL